MVMSLVWHLFWYRQLCSFSLLVHVLSRYPSFGNSLSRCTIFRQVALLSISLSISIGYLIVMGLVWHLLWYWQLCSFSLLVHVLSRYLSFGNSMSRCTIFRQVALLSISLSISIGYLMVMSLVWHLFWYRQLCSFSLLVHVLSRYLSFGNSLSRYTIFRQMALSISRVLFILSVGPYIVKISVFFDNSLLRRTPPSIPDQTLVHIL